MGKRLCMVIVQVSWEVERLKKVGLFLGDVPKMLGHLVVTEGESLNGCSCSIANTQLF